jgi:D-2-hydroxyacid dehydrogenase (NADP+)
MKIVILNYTNPNLRPIMEYTAEHVAQITAILPGAQIDVIEPTPKALAAHLPTADILVMSPLDHGKIVDFSQASRLKWVHITAAGATDTAAKLRDTPVLLTNSSGVHPIPIAEHVFTFMLMFARHMYESHRRQLQQKQWSQEHIATHLSELHSATVGIVGFGRIGKRVAEVAKGFDMRVVALSHSDPAVSNPAVDQFYTPQQSTQLLQESDFVINCLPLTDETEHFFGKDMFAGMKPSAYFINIGRGKTVVEQDLIQALEQGVIAGAGLDVFDEEPLPASSRLWKLDNAIITPHYAGWTPRYIDRVITIFCSNLQAYTAGKEMPTAVDKLKKY